MRDTRFRDRTQAGRILATQLAAYANRCDVLVLALPRGGIPVGVEVARALHAPLDVLVVRKLGVPGEEELAMGAIATGGIRLLNEEVVRGLGISDEVIDKAAAREQRELERREHLYRGDRPAYDALGRTILLVDDGMATGATMHAAVEALRKGHPARIVVAVPTAARSTYEEFAAQGVEVACVIKPEPFYGVGLWYERFPHLSDEAVCDLLARAWREEAIPPGEEHREQSTINAGSGKRGGPL
jgi:putative phosphoribosyl transferase